MYNFSIDNWAYYLDFITASLESETLEQTLNFLKEMASVEGSHSRAPYLAQLELLKRIHNTDKKCDIDILDYMRRYFTKFGSKGCVVGDLRLYLHLLTPEERQQLILNVSIIYF